MISTKTLATCCCILLCGISPSRISFVLSLSPTNTKSASTTTIIPPNQVNINPFPPSRINLNGIEHYIRDTGDPIPSSLCPLSPPPPIAILLHGLAGSTDSWEDTAPLLFSSGIRAIAIDRVGFGRTERPSPPSLPFPPPPPSFLPSFVREGVASAIEALPLPGLDFLPGGVADIVPKPNVALATAVRRPELLGVKLPWSMSEYKADPYSSEFAVSVLWPLLREKLSVSKLEEGSVPRKVYFVGHSAGGPIALKAFADALDANQSNGGNASGGLFSSKDAPLVPAGVALIAPAVLDPEEDPGIYDFIDEDEEEGEVGMDSTARRNNNLRLAVFKTVLALPDAFGVPIVRRIYDGRNITEALLNQTYSLGATANATTMGGESDDDGDDASSSSTASNGLSNERANYLANKYKSPVDEYPDEWDVGLLNVYRADLRNNDNEKNKNGSPGGSNKIGSSAALPSRGRGLLLAVRDMAARSSVKTVLSNDNEEPPLGSSSSSRSTPNRPTFCVISGDDDRVVPARASRRVVDILSSNDDGVGGDGMAAASDEAVYVEIEGTGHLPMDEKPEEMARVLLDFML